MATAPQIRLASVLGRRPEPAVREERLRITSQLSGTPAIALSAWRGRSGCRYVVGVHACSCPDLREHDDAVLLAVHRSEDGRARLVAMAAYPGCSVAEWIERSVRAGATEIHVHRLAAGEGERAAVTRDLTSAEVA
ncbi:hypothetical protein [Methylobacterium gnaphalii]|uniref:Uncharacterized protein n=1 Tax=Methylobacterium gnaphalii TaxID=1010610 RepID=A0A512JIT1_9HYPH|nr:hypothetical protein [Methylobacterium gnaphalii]GEP09867.1 hypothetical protein MGN01_17120 [Methylobacterium gnaphalii]GJD67217.1 hypothetical protein MMMDOFMJ_0131 [Methylobacterium gnaphalii]GLS49896.1 hypothetical protein GCM10007885_27480 [Methylobacterium gnaphalii]